MLFEDQGLFDGADCHGMGFAQGVIVTRYKLVKEGLNGQA